MPELRGNKGEWSEIYIFLKLMTDGQIYAADRNMEKLENVFLKIIKIIREEISSQKYEYYTGEKIKIFLNGTQIEPVVTRSEFAKNKDLLWKLLPALTNEEHACSEVEPFLSSIYITKLKAPASSRSEFFGGTQDITMEVMDYRSGIDSVVGFSCKSDFTANATLFNASQDNTNFIFEVTGKINDDIMDSFNTLFKYVMKNGERTARVATGARMHYLKECGCDLKYCRMCIENAERNLILSGGTEMPAIVAAMLKAYYFDGEGKTKNSSMLYLLEQVIEQNAAGYHFADTASLYYHKLGTLLYDMFTGMRLARPWDGRSSVNGGYIIAKNDGEVLAYHSCMADEFKDFLVERLGLESPSATRHNYMQIYKDGGRYYLNLNLQVRFKKKSANYNISELKMLSAYLNQINNN